MNFGETRCRSVCLWDHQTTRCSLQLKHFASRGGFVFCMFGWRSGFLCARYCSLRSRVVKRIQGFWDLLCRIHFLGTSVLKRVQLLQLKKTSSVTTLPFAHVLLSSKKEKPCGSTSSLRLILVALLHFGNNPCRILVGRLIGLLGVWRVLVQSQKLSGCCLHWKTDLVGFCC